MIIILFTCNVYLLFRLELICGLKLNVIELICGLKLNVIP